MNKKLIYLFMLLIALTSLMALWAVQIPQMTPTTEVQSWQLPTLEHPDLAAYHGQLNRTQLWKMPPPKKLLNKREQQRLEVKQQRQKEQEQQQKQAALEAQQQQQTQVEQQQQQQQRQRQQQKAELKNQFIGIIHQGQRRAILLLNPQQQVVAYELGSTVPQGFAIVSIADDWIKVAQGKDVEVIHLYR